MSSVNSEKTMAVSRNVTGIPTPRHSWLIRCSTLKVGNVAFTVAVKLMQGRSYVAYRNQQNWLWLDNLINNSLWLGVTYNVVVNVTFDAVDVTFA